MTSVNAHFLLFFLLADAVTMRWLDIRLYIFPPVKILPLVLCKIREEIVILDAPFWPNQMRFPDLSLADGPPMADPPRGRPVVSNEHLDMAPQPEDF